MQIEQGRRGRYCKLDVRIGNLVAYPNGQLQFENYATDGQSDHAAGLFERREGIETKARASSTVALSGTLEKASTKAQTINDQRS